jgi:hypothetical protein
MVARGLSTELCIGMMGPDTLLDVGYYDFVYDDVDPELAASVATGLLENNCHSASSTIVCRYNASAIASTGAPYQPS